MKNPSSRLRNGWMLGLLAGLTACSAHPVKIDCESALRPINLPTPLSQQPPVTPSAAASAPASSRRSGSGVPSAAGSAP